MVAEKAKNEVNKKYAHRTYFQMVTRRFFRNGVAVTGFIIVASLILVAIFAPYIATHDPIATNPDESLQPPSAKHWFGTDQLGRDVYSRIVYGARVSLFVGFISTGISVTIGIIIGSIAGYYGGWIDDLISRFIEVMMCFPTFFLILTIMAFFKPSIWTVLVVIGITSWTGVARLIRGQILQVKEMEYVQAAKTLGMSDARIIFRHILPNAITPVLVSATLSIGGAILTETSLSFLGLGVQPPNPSWGNILSDGQQFIQTAWWLSTFPGIAIFLAVLGYNLMGEGLRDALDPKLK